MKPVRVCVCVCVLVPFIIDLVPTVAIDSCVSYLAEAFHPLDTWLIPSRRRARATGAVASYFKRPQWCSFLNRCRRQHEDYMVLLDSVISVH